MRFVAKTYIVDCTFKTKIGIGRYARKKMCIQGHTGTVNRVFLIPGIAVEPPVRVKQNGRVNKWLFPVIDIAINNKAGAGLFNAAVSSSYAQCQFSELISILNHAEYAAQH